MTRLLALLHTFCTHHSHTHTHTRTHRCATTDNFLHTKVSDIEKWFQSNVFFILHRMKSTTSVKSASSPKKISKITSNSVRPSRICINYRPLENICWFPSPVVRKPSPEAKKGQNPITSPSPVHHQSWKPHHHTYHHQWRLIYNLTLLRVSTG